MATELEKVTIIGQRENQFSISNFKTAIGKPVRPNLFKAILRGWDDNEVLMGLMSEDRKSVV